MMNAVLFNTDDSRGGAARSAMRLHEALRAEKIDSTFFVKKKFGTDSSVVEHGASSELNESCATIVQEFYVNNHRTPLTNTLFSAGHPGVTCASHPIVQQADILNLHWVTNFLSAPEIGELINTGKPLVWTFHDQWAMTGGCHYTAGCRQFTDACKICPQLMEDPAGLVEAMFQDKLETYADKITVVTPSRWMAQEARASRIFRNSRIEVIPYSLDLQAFAPQSKAAIREQMGIPADAFVFLFACSAAVESRKGGNFLKEIMLALSRIPEIQTLRDTGKLWLLCFGWDTAQISTNSFAEKHLGFLRDDKALCDAYNAADILLHLSTEDNLPNTVLEAMACGTPVMALDAGGARDLLGENENGWLLPQGNADLFATEIAKLIQHQEECAAVGCRARRRMEEQYIPKLQASRYLKLFSELVSAPSAARVQNSVGRLSRKFPEALQRAVQSGITVKHEKAELLLNLENTHKTLQTTQNTLQTTQTTLHAALAQKDHELQTALLQLERVKRNIGYRVTHGVSLGLKRIEKAVRPGKNNVEFIPPMENPADLLKFWPAENKAFTQPLPATLPGGKPWPKISIVTPSYNQGHYIEQTILSVANQNYPNVEHIVMDGGSKDDTVKIIRKHERKLACWVSEKDGGQSNAINNGMERATGEIVTWLNSDDMLAPGALAAVAMAFHTSNADMVAGICQLHRDNKFVHQHLTSCPNGPLPLEDLLDLENCVERGQFFYQPEVFYKKELWLRAGGRVDPSLHWGMDQDLWIRFAMAGAKLKVIGRPIALFRVHDQQKTHDPASFRDELKEVHRKYRESHGLAARPVIPEKNLKTQLGVMLFNDIGFNYGAGIAHKRLAEALTLAGHKVKALAAARPGSEIPKGSPVSDLVLDALSKQIPDLVVLGNLHGAGLPPEIVSRVAERFPTVFVTHDFWLITGRCVYTKNCDKYLNGCDASCPTAQEYPRIEPEKIADAWRTKLDTLTGKNRLLLMANSRYVAEKINGLFSHLTSTKGAEPCALEQVHLGLSTEVYRPFDKFNARKQLHLPQDKFIIMFSSGDLADERKGLKYLFAAVEQLNLPNLAMVCVGWRDKQKPLPREDIIEAGYISDPKIQALYYAAVDLFVGPSSAETFGQVFIEAAACGTPSVGYRVTAIPETIFDGITGRLADELTSESLAACIADLCQNEGLRRDMAAWGRILMENDFSMPTYYHRLFVMLRKMLNTEDSWLVPKISLALDPVRLKDAVYLQETLLQEQASTSTDAAEREHAAYQLYRQQLDDFRNAKFPWIFLPAAWRARRRRDRHKARLDKLKSSENS